MSIIGQTVHVLTINHRHGYNQYICASEEGAKAQLLQYVEENWEGENRDDVPKPTDPDELIQAYFSDAVASDEYATTETAVIQD